MFSWALHPPALAQLIRRPLVAETVFYVAVSGLDVLLTYLLLYGEGSMVFVESNPVARFFLEWAGFCGMVVYKVVLVVMVAINCWLIARSRPQTARRLIRFADLAVLVVVGYSLFLMWRYS